MRLALERGSFVPKIGRSRKPQQGIQELNHSTSLLVVLFLTIQLIRSQMMLLDELAKRGNVETERSVY